MTKEVIPRYTDGLLMDFAAVKKQKTPTCIREIQVHKLWTKVYSQQGLTAMLLTIIF